MKKIENYIVLSIVFLSCLFTLQQFYMGFKETESPDSIYNLWALIFMVLIATWCQKDAQGKNWPFEYGYFVFLFWPVVLPYYLIKTRGLEGFIMFIGFGALSVVPNIAWIIGYQYS